MSIRIAIADDHPVVAAGMANLLREYEHFNVIAIYHSGAALLAGLEREQPDVLLLDIQFPDTTGNELMKIIAQQYPKVRVLAVTSVNNVFDIKEMMQLGGKGYILKSAALEVLIEAIEKIYAGEEYLEPVLKERLYQTLLNPAGQKRSEYKLTQRELTILELLAEGKTNNEIAAQLILSHRTIENNRLSLYQKLEVNNTAALLNTAYKKGLLKP